MLLALPESLPPLDKSSKGISSGGKNPDLYFSITSIVSLNKTNDQHNKDDDETTTTLTSFSLMMSAAFKMPSKHLLIIGNTLRSISTELRIKFLIFLILFSSSSCNCRKTSGSPERKCCRCSSFVLCSCIAYSFFAVSQT
jgi:hypothetical protein